MTAPADLIDTAEYPEYAPAPELVDQLDEGDQAAAAPRGVTKDGRARRKPGPPKGSPARGGRRAAGTRRPTGAGGSGFPAPPKKATPNAAAAPSKDYAAGVVNLLGIPQGILTGVGLLPGQDKFLADAAAISMFAPALGQAAAQFAADQPTHPLVRWIDRAITVGPYAMFGTAAVSFLAQLAVNHGALSAGLLGTAPPKMLIDHMRAQLGNAAEFAEQG